MPYSIKVHIFWEGHKILQNLHLTFVQYAVPVKSKVEISQNFVDFSENMNFKEQLDQVVTLQCLPPKKSSCILIRPIREQDSEIWIDFTDVHVLAAMVKTSFASSNF